MTAHEPRTGKARLVGRFLWHYAEMTIAMLLGMLLLGMVVPKTGRFGLDTLIMAANMTIGMSVWMAVRRHSRPRIAEMGLAMIVPFVILLVPYWFGAVSQMLVMSLGHTLMFVAMALVMVWRHEEYTHHHHKLPVRPKWIWRATVVLIALLPAAAISATNTIGRFADRYEARTDHVTVDPTPKQHDPSKPTVAFVVGSKGANVADLLGPYDVLAGTGRVNTYVVSAGARLVTLTGGLDIVPDMTFDELGQLLRNNGDKLDAVVIPAEQEMDATELASVTGWIRRQYTDGALTVSVCAGARTLAATGLLDGRPATSHWLRLSGLQNDFPKVNWERGVRYVDDGNIITAAGVLSGVDGGLRILERLTDADTARQAANRVHWRYYSPGSSARIPENSLQWADFVAPLNTSYQTGPTTVGVQLVDGTDELELASAFVSYTEQAMVARTVAVGDAPIRSKHGLTFVPRTKIAAAGDFERLLVPGLDAARQHAGAPGGEYLHQADEFAFDPVLRDIARTYDVATAHFAAKTLEYPVMDVQLTGQDWPWGPTIVPIALILVSAGVAITGGIVFRRIRAKSAPAPTIPAPMGELVHS
ncbi:DJ-1/PfpI family protein [Actinocrispum sp. NPDC049592]|uniref:DJ-1/PfpI family protein n=1 Tax=Actinocrispum sp. NPDC049592 TaxID=3154835 RepID=UPI00343F2647